MSVVFFIDDLFYMKNCYLIMNVNNIRYIKKTKKKTIYYDEIFLTLVGKCILKFYHHFIELMSVTFVENF